MSRHVRVFSSRDEFLVTKRLYGIKFDNEIPKRSPLAGQSKYDELVIKCDISISRCGAISRKLSVIDTHCYLYNNQRLEQKLTQCSTLRRDDECSRADNRSCQCQAVRSEHSNKQNIARNGNERTERSRVGTA